MGAGPPCCTCVIMLPAAAMTYVKPSNGLEPSVYGGGGSPSSRSLLSLVSLGSAALVSTRTELAEASRAPGVVGVADSDSSNGGAGPEGGGARTVSECDASDAVTRVEYGSSGDGAGKYREGKLWAEKGGGDSVAEDELSCRGCARAK